MAYPYVVKGGFSDRHIWSSCVLFMYFTRAFFCFCFCLCSLHAWGWWREVVREDNSNYILVVVGECLVQEGQLLYRFFLWGAGLSRVDRSIGTGMGYFVGSVPLCPVSIDRSIDGTEPRNHGAYFHE